MTRSPGARRGSSAPQTPADTISGAAKPSRSEGQRESQSAARKPTGARRSVAWPNAGNGNVGRRGNSSSRARRRASSSTAVRTSSGVIVRHPGTLGPFSLLALDPGLPAVAGRSVLAGELDVRDLGIGDGERAVAILIEELDEGFGYEAVPVEDVADDLRPVALDDRGVASVVEREVDHLGDRQELPDFRHPAFQCHCQS